jgi:YD repeat-containing protein
MHTNGCDFTYDADGNLERTVRPGYDDLQLGWNSLGQMTTAWRYQRGSASYGYDALGRRVQRVDGNGSVVRYLYDGDDLLMELNASGQPIREYTHNPGVDRPHAVRMKCESRGGLTYPSARRTPNRHCCKHEAARVSRSRSRCAGQSVKPRVGSTRTS